MTPSCPPPSSGHPAPEPSPRAAWTPAGLDALRLALSVGGAPAGGLLLVDRGRRWFELRGLAVAPAWRGRGYGRLLVALAMERAFAAGRTHLRLVVDDDGSGALRRWYGELGYYPAGVDARGRAILEAPVGRRHAILRVGRPAKGEADVEREAEPGLPGDAGDQRREL